MHEELQPSDVRGVPKHNKFCERMFGYFDSLLRHRPNISTLTAEAFTLHAMNKTGEWIDAMGPEVRNNVIRES